MTLYRQLLFFTVTILLFLFICIWFANLNTTKSFLINQLESHAQDTATSLGLSISTHLKTLDSPAMESMVDAIFDRGYYKNIVLKDLDDNLLLQRDTAMKLEDIPSWFIQFTNLPTPQASAQIMDGWRQMGSVWVESHPGYAYKSLWQSALSTAFWFTAVGLGTILLGGIGLKFLLNPLRKIEEQAQAICNRHYLTQKPLPKTRELRSVVAAMNKVTEKVQETFTSQTKIAHQLRKKVYLDPVTGVSNRRYLEGQVDSRVTRKKQPVAGGFLIVRICGLTSLNEEKGYQKGDLLLKEAAAILQNIITLNENAILARLTGPDFAILLPATEEEAVKSFAENINKSMQQLVTTNITPEKKAAFIGGYHYRQALSFTRLLAGADEALRLAQSSGNSAIISQHVDSGTAAAPKDRSDWKNILSTAIDKKTISLFVQPVVNAGNTDEIVHHEILSRIKDSSGNSHRAGMFISLAEQLHLIHSLDKIILEQIFSTITIPPNPPRIAINLSPTALTDQDFRTWLVRTLEEQSRQSKLRLNFEFAEHALIPHLQLIKLFSQKMQQIGHHIGIDHFGQGLINFGYLKSLRPNYVKIDRAFTNELKDEEGESFFFINSLCNVAHSVDIRIIAEGIENDRQLQMLKKINLDAYQGYLFGKPFPLENFSTLKETTM